jgi:hypothetical protein
VQLGKIHPPQPLRGGIVRAAAQAAGVTRQGAYKAAKNNAEFKAAWGEALEDACDDMEAVRRRQQAER